MRKGNAAHSIERGLSAHLSRKKSRCAQGHCRREHELKIPYAHVGRGTSSKESLGKVRSSEKTDLSEKARKDLLERAVVGRVFLRIGIIFMPL